jgi:hypothetical protein
MTAPSPRRRFQFRLRTLMIGVTLFALIPCGYVGWQAKIVRDRKRMTDRDSPVRSYLYSDIPGEAIPWIRRRLGDKEYHHIDLVDSASDATVGLYLKAFPEAAVVHRVSQHKVEPSLLESIFRSFHKIPKRGPPSLPATKS